MRCVNCKTERDDLIEHDGELWCPEYGDCDRALYYRDLGCDIEESERLEAERRAAEREPERIATVDPFGGVTITWQ